MSTALARQPIKLNGPRWPLYAAAVSAVSTMVVSSQLNRSTTATTVNNALLKRDTATAASVLLSMAASLKGDGIKRQFVEAGCVESLSRRASEAGGSKPVDLMLFRKALAPLLESEDGREQLLERCPSTLAAIVQGAVAYPTSGPSEGSATVHGPVDLVLVSRLLQGERATQAVLHEAPNILNHLTSFPMESPLLLVSVKALSNVTEHSPELLFEGQTLEFLLAGLVHPSSKLCRERCEQALHRIALRVNQSPELMQNNFDAWQQLQPFLNTEAGQRGAMDQADLWGYKVSPSHAFRVFGGTAVGGALWGLIRGQTLAACATAASGAVVISAATFAHAVASLSVMSAQNADHNTELMCGGTAPIVMLLSTWAVLRHAPFSFGGFVIGLLSLPPRPNQWQ